MHKKVKTGADIKADPRIEMFIPNYEGYGKHMVECKDGYRFEYNSSTIEIGNLKELCYEVNERLEKVATKRLFIEIAGEDNDKLTTISLDSSSRHGLEMTNSFFDTVIHNANKNKKEILDAINTHDEIYASTAFYAQGEETSGDLFNNLMQYAIATNIIGKKVYLWREYSQISWTELDNKLLRNCFIRNQLYVKLNDGNWEQVNVKKIK